MIPVQASLNVEGTLGEKMYVTFAIEEINSTLYQDILEKKIFNSSTIPQAISNYFAYIT